MRAAYRVKFTIEGRPFHVRRDRVLSVAIALAPGKPVTGEDNEPIVNMEGTDYVREDPTEQVMIFVDGIGNLPIDESLEDALVVWDGITRSDFDDRLEG